MVSLYQEPHGRVSVGAPLLCDLHVITRLASRALGSPRVPKKLVAVSDIFSILRHILSLSQYRLHYLAPGSITISANFKQKRFYQNPDSSSPGAWYVTIHQPIYSRIRFCCLLIFRVNVVIVTLRVTASSQDVFSVFMIVAKLKLKQSSKPNLIYRVSQKNLI